MTLADHSCLSHLKRDVLSQALQSHQVLVPEGYLYMQSNKAVLAVFISIVWQASIDYLLCARFYKAGFTLKELRRRMSQRFLG